MARPTTPISLISLDGDAPAKPRPLVALGPSGNEKAVEPSQAPSFAYQRNMDRIYINPDGSDTVLRGGTRTWRNNNPGNVKYGDHAKQYGAIGRDQENFAIFPDSATGAAAMKALLKTTGKYRDATLPEVVTAYAPPNENDTSRYQQFILRVVDVDETTLVRDLTPEQFDRLVDGIRRFEGWRVGSTARDAHQGPVPSEE